MSKCKWTTKLAVWLWNSLYKLSRKQSSKPRTHRVELLISQQWQQWHCVLPSSAVWHLRGISKLNFSSLPWWAAASHVLGIADVGEQKNNIDVTTGMTRPKTCYNILQVWLRITPYNYSLHTFSTFCPQKMVGLSLFGKNIQQKKEKLFFSLEVSQNQGLLSLHWVICGHLGGRVHAAGGQNPDVPALLEVHALLGWGNPMWGPGLTL